MCVRMMHYYIRVQCITSDEQCTAKTVSKHLADLAENTVQLPDETNRDLSRDCMSYRLHVADLTPRSVEDMDCMSYRCEALPDTVHG